MTKAEPTMTPEEEAEWAELLQRGELDVVFNKPTTPSHTPTIKEILLSRYPCQSLPRGALVAIGKEVGVTRERVRQVALQLGYGPCQQKDRTRWCKDCGSREPQPRSNICYECAWPLVSCDYCGTHFRRRRNMLLDWSTGKRRNAGRYLLCSQKCRSGMQRRQPFARGVPKSGQPQAYREATRQQILAFITNYTATHDEAPTQKEVAAHLGMRHFEGVHHWLTALKKDGLIDWKPYTPRTLRVLEGAQ